MDLPDWRFPAADELDNKDGLICLLKTTSSNYIHMCIDDDANLHGISRARALSYLQYILERDRGLTSDQGSEAETLKQRPAGKP